MIRRELNGIPYYTFEALDTCKQVVNAVFTRLGGASEPPFAALNVGRLVGDDLMAVETNHRLIYEILGISAEEVVTAHQVHGDRVALVDAADGGKVMLATDGLITKTRGVSLMLRFADCLPIFLYDPQNNSIGLAHAGWRGTAAKIAQRLVSAMAEAVGSDPSTIIGGLGPAIGPCCYQVGPEVAERLKPSLTQWQKAVAASPDSTFSLDLWEANRQQLVEAGVKKVELSRLCTACHADEFFSHRREKGRTGRFAAIMGIKK